MELCDSDLSQLIKQGQQLPEDDCIKILAQICEGFLVLVKEGIIHRYQSSNIEIWNHRT